VITAVLDTNALASGFRGVRNPVSTPGQIIQAWNARQFQLVVSEHVLGELRRAFGTRYFTRYLSAQQIADALRALEDEATLTPITAPVHGVATHPEDDLILATAVSANASYLVTGDGPLQKLGAYEGVTIVSPREFLDILEAERGDV